MKCCVLSHTELRRYYNTKVHDEVLIENPMAIRLWTVAFTPVGEKENQTLMSGGRLLREEELDSYSVGFAGRLRSVGGGVQIYPVQITDSGTFAFRDRRGHLFQTAELVVDPGEQRHIVFLKCRNELMIHRNVTPAPFFCSYRLLSNSSFGWTNCWDSLCSDFLLLLCEEVLL